MCGITGFISNRGENNREIIDKMTAEILHRGPDENGFFIDDKVALGMRRLSIIDLSSGKQPIFSLDQSKMIFFNGEIYNYKELKSEMESQGHHFKTNSDTEVILRMFEVYGPSCLPRLRGMFVFCIYDTKARKLFLARDFFGIKPLYYFLADGKVSAFSSEIKSFFSVPNFKPEVNDDAVYNYLSFQYNPLRETFFKSVFSLPPAHYMEIDLETGLTNIEKYWSFEISPDQTLDKEKTTKKIFETMEDSVSHHMIADVPVGSFLSGGIDSSIIASLMQKIRSGKKIKTFTVGFKVVSEGEEAKETSNFLGTDHTEISVGKDEYFKALPDAVWYFDEPVGDPSAIGLYFLAREARKYVTVVLSGEGADELFGGYNIYLEPFARAKISWLPRSFLKWAVSLPFNFYGKNYLERASRKMEDWYIGNASIFKPKDLTKLWKGDKPEVFSLKNLYDKVSHLSDSSKMQYIDVNTWLVGDILAKADKMTMAHSLELRVPFLDIEVARLAVSLPDRFKWHNGVTKYLLRKSFDKFIPESTRNRKKLGFPTPVRKWFKDDPCFVETLDGKKTLYEAISSCDYIKSKMNMVEVKKIIDDHTSGKSDNSRKVYLLLMLALWYERFIK